MGNIISREYLLLDMLRGKENVIQLLDFFYTIDENNKTIQNTVLEFCDKSLEICIKEANQKNEFLPMSDIKKYTKQIFNGLKNMHELGICHRDLKPENILLKEGEVKICDVGSSKIIDMSSKKLNTPYIVSRYYRAPELILACNNYDFSIDIWATGCIIFELLTKIILFQAEAEAQQIVEYQQVLGPLQKSELDFYLKNLSPGICELFKRCVESE